MSSGEITGEQRADKWTELSSAWTETLTGVRANLLMALEIARAIAEPMLRDKCIVDLQELLLEAHDRLRADDNDDPSKPDMSPAPDGPLS